MSTTVSRITAARVAGGGPLRSVAVVTNGAAGALLADPAAEAGLAAHFTAAGLQPLFVPADAGNLSERLVLACGMAVDAVVVAGGDGTVACAAHHLLGTGIPLGIVPFGTMNLLARDLGLPVRDTAAAIGVLASGVITAIDVGDVDGHVFLCASMLGLPARLARIRESGRGTNRVLAWGRFALAATRALLRGRRLALAIHGDGQQRRVVAQSITITVNKLTPDASNPFGRSRLDGGVFGVYLVGRLRLWEVPRLAWNAFRGRLTGDIAVRASEAQHLVIGAGGGRIRVMNDGEVRLLRPPLRYRMRPAALRVIAPGRKPGREPGRAP